jgi:DNA (cytosine-5)-methyltransferase 1
MKIISLFTGCGGLDKGFENAGFNVVWANEYDKTIWETFQKNFPKASLNTKDIRRIKSSEIPDAIGIIGGPPCQSWSLAGSMGGINDYRGKLFYEYLRILKDKKPIFFLAENVAGMLSSAHFDSFKKIIKAFARLGYNISYKLVNVADYGVPQDRLRVIVVGYRKDILKKHFEFPKELGTKLTLRHAIADLKKPLPAKGKNKTNGILSTEPANHEYMTGGFSTIYMSRNRKRDWEEPSFTIQAGGRHAPLHPSAKPMIKLGQDEWTFDSTSKQIYRRLSIRECARIQTFPDNFVFYYDSVVDGYKMIGNAVPVKFAEEIAKVIKKDVAKVLNARPNNKKAEKPFNVAYKINQYATREGVL